MGGEVLYYDIAILQVCVNWERNCTTPHTRKAEINKYVMIVHNYNQVCVCKYPKYIILVCTVGPVYNGWGDEWPL